jgi:hypothetical protein
LSTFFTAIYSAHFTTDRTAISAAILPTIIPANGTTIFTAVLSSFFSTYYTAKFSAIICTITATFNSAKQCAFYYSIHTTEY